MGAARDGEGFKRRMTSVGRSVEGCKGWLGGNRATLVVPINTTPPRLAFATYLSRRVAREQNLTLSLSTSRARGWNHRAGERRSPWTWTGPSFNPPSFSLARITLLEEEKIQCVMKRKHATCMPQFITI